MNKKSFKRSSRSTFEKKGCFRLLRYKWSEEELNKVEISDDTSLSQLFGA